MVCLGIVVLKLLTSAADKNGQEILKLFLGLLLFPLLMMKSWMWLWSCKSPCCSLPVLSGLTVCWEIGNNFLLNFLVLRHAWSLRLGGCSLEQKVLFSATSPVRIRSLVWIFCKDFLKMPHFFFFFCAQTSFVLFQNSGPHKARHLLQSVCKWCSYNDSVPSWIVLFHGELSPSQMWPASVSPTLWWHSLSTWDCRAGFTLPGFQCFWNPGQISPIQSGDRRILFPL